MPSPAEITVSNVREWARQRGLPVGTRGRISPALVNAYNSAHRTNKYLGSV